MRRTGQGGGALWERGARVIFLKHRKAKSEREEEKIGEKRKIFAENLHG